MGGPGPSCSKRCAPTGRSCGIRPASRTKPPRWPGTRCGWLRTAGLRTVAGEVAAARWLDAEDATTRQVLAWAIKHDAQIARRLADALGWWWRLAGQYRLLREVA